MTKVLIIGSGGREHTIAWKLAQSPKVSGLVVAPGNDGITKESVFGHSTSKTFERWECILGKGEEHYEPLAKRAQSEGIGLAVIGPDNPLSEGIVDIFEKHQILTFGPRKKAAQLESSKAFAKEVMAAAGVPTAKYKKFEELAEALFFIQEVEWGKGWVVKADGLAFGKGVEVCSDRKQASRAVERLFKISGSLVIEEKLEGEEISWMALCDGKNVVLLDPARDYKPLRENNRGPNTGGMGAYSPVPEVMRDEVFLFLKKNVFQPILAEMRNREIPFQGVLYGGFMWDVRQSELEKQFKVLEFNARFGDPETQVLLPRMQGDFYDWCRACASGKLDQMPARVDFSSQAAVTVVVAAPGYPENPEKDLPISFEDFSPVKVSKDLISPPCFYAGVKKKNGQFVTDGGRVLSVLGLGDSLSQASDRAYEQLSQLKFDRMHYRRDIARE